MGRLQAAIFDMDGVLTDTLMLHYKACYKMFKEEGYAFDFELFKQEIDTRPRLQGIKAVAKGAKQEDHQRMADKKQRYFLELLEKEPPEIFEDAFILIEHLKANGIKIGVASSSKNAEFILKQVNKYDLFDTIVSGNDIRKGKPNPEIFLTAANRLQVYPQECIVFEDAAEGVRAGVDAGMFTIGLARCSNEQELQHAHMILEDLEKISKKQLEKHMKSMAIEPLR